jgi:PAS domain S-box-containing protein
MPMRNDDPASRVRDCLEAMARLFESPRRCPEGVQETADALLAALAALLPARLLYLRVEASPGCAPMEFERPGPHASSPTEAVGIGMLLSDQFGAAPGLWPSCASLRIGASEYRVAIAPLGPGAAIGAVAVVSDHEGFPDVGESEALAACTKQAAAVLAQAGRQGGRGQGDAGSAPAVIENIPGLIATLSASGKVEAVNGRTVAFVGALGRDGRRRRALHDIFHPEDRRRALRIARQAIAAGAAHEYEVRLRGADGTYRWFQLRGKPLRDAAGFVTRWYLLLTDVDDLRRAQEALAASEKRTRLIVDAIPGMVWSADSRGSATFFNRGYLDLLGMTWDQAAGSGWMAAVHPEDLRAVAALWRRIVDSGAPGEFEARLRMRADGHGWFLCRANPMRDGAGVLTAWYCVNTDIDDRKQAETKLREALGHLVEAQRLSKTGSYTTDPVPDEHDWSDEFYRNCGFELGSRITLQRVRDIVHPEDGPHYDAAIAQCLGGLDADFEFRVITEGGQVKHLRCVAHRLAHITDRPVFIGAVQDVTEDRVAEEALNKARFELARVARVATISELTASIAHQVQRPLASIVRHAAGCLEVLNAALVDLEGAREKVRRITRDASRAAEEIERLRAMFRKGEFTRAPMDLNDATREVIALLLSDLRRSRVMVQPDFAEPLPSVLGDRIQLQQVILNLLRNASEAMAGVHDRPRRLVISTARSGERHVRLSVRDDGIGLDPAAAEKLFDAFYTTKIGGIGIGLSVSRSIIEQHDGRIWAEGNEGPGATVSIVLPCAQAGGASPTPRSPA